MSDKVTDKQTQNQINHIEKLRAELAEVRAESLKATRQGDFMKVARLTAAAAQLNRSIASVETSISSKGWDER